MRMAVLWQHLPEESRCARRHRPELAWDNQTYMLWHIEHQLRCLAWGMSDKRKRSPRAPEPIRTPGQMAEQRRRVRNALANRREIDRILGKEGGNGD